MLEYLFDHGRIFDARNHLDRTAAVVTGLDINLKHALQPLRPCHRDVARGLVGGLSATPGDTRICARPAIGVPFISAGLCASGAGLGSRKGDYVESLSVGSVCELLIERDSRQRRWVAFGRAT